MLAVSVVERAALDVEISLVGIIHNSSPHLAFGIFFNAQDAIFVVVGGFAGGGVEIAVFHNHENAVVATELTQREAMVFVVDAEHIGVEPHLSVAESGHAMLFKGDAVHLIFGHQIAPGEFALDAQIRQVDIKLEHLQARLRFESDA